MLQQIISKFPDDNPITAISVVEDISAPAPGFFVISKTHDQDSDADLWKANTFFGGRISRYLCISKEERIADYIVESIGVIGEKDNPPDGYCLIPRTMDTDAKAWKKRQICYSLTRRFKASSAVTDIILLSKNKKAPDGFKLAGDINGLAVCFKVNTDFQNAPTSPVPAPVPALGYSLNPNGVQFPKATPGKGIYPSVSPGQPVSPNDEYVNLLMPKRRAPDPPVSPRHPPPLPQRPPVKSAYGTLNAHTGLEGIPFILHPTLQFLAQKKPTRGPTMKFKTKDEIETEYRYNFYLERQCT